MRIVVGESKMMKSERVDRAFGLDHEPGQGSRLAGELEPGLVEMVEVEMSVTESVDEIADGEIADLGNEVGQ